MSLSNSCVRFLAALGVLCIVASSGAQPILNPANGHYYELVTTPRTWANARAEAETRMHAGVAGHLVTISNQQEQDFLITTFGQSMREKYIGGSEVNMIWDWVNGEPFNYTNWAPGEPNGGGVINFHGANALGSWNDVPASLQLGYFVEYDTLFTFSLNKTSVAGQNYVQGSIVQGTMPTNTTYTTYDNSSLVTTPASVTVLANQTTALFPIQVVAVNSQINTTIYARRGVITVSRPLTLTPLIPTALAFTPSPVTGGQSVSCRVVINGVAGPGGRTIAVFDNSANTTMPSTVTVPPGGTQVTFTINTATTPFALTSIVTARVSAGEKTAILRISASP
jgi:hypothetical protein